MSAAESGYQACGILARTKRLQQLFAGNDTTAAARGRLREAGLQYPAMAVSGR